MIIFFVFVYIYKVLFFLYYIRYIEKNRLCVVTFFLILLLTTTNKKLKLLNEKINSPHPDSTVSRAVKKKEKNAVSDETTRDEGIRSRQSEHVQDK